MNAQAAYAISKKALSMANPLWLNRCYQAIEQAAGNGLFEVIIPATEIGRSQEIREALQAKGYSADFRGNGTQTSPEILFITWANADGKSQEPEA